MPSERPLCHWSHALGRSWELMSETWAELLSARSLHHRLESLPLWAPGVEEWTGVADGCAVARPDSRVAVALGAAVAKRTGVDVGRRAGGSVARDAGVGVSASRASWAS